MDDFIRTSKRLKLSVVIESSICLPIKIRKYNLIVYAKSKEPTKAVYLLPSTERDSRFDLYYV